jgi:hypothetical protein
MAIWLQALKIIAYNLTKKLIKGEEIFIKNQRGS